MSIVILTAQKNMLTEETITAGRMVPTDKYQ